MKWTSLLMIAARLCAGSFEDTIPSTPEEIASLNAATVVGGFVSAASGQPSLAQDDLRVIGAQDLSLQRIYLPPQILGRYSDREEEDRYHLGIALHQLEFKGWVVLPHLWIDYHPESKLLRTQDSRGVVQEFQVEGNRGFLKTAGYGCSNLAGGEAAAKADIRNVELTIEGNQITIIWPSGVQSIYQWQSNGRGRLECEMLPNGKAIRYAYRDQALLRISSTDASGKYTYASIDKIGESHYRGSDGREASYHEETRTIKGKLKASKKETSTISFDSSVMTYASNPIYSNRIGYNERQLPISYDAQDFPISCSYFEPKGSPCRIQSLSTPSGTTTFTYDPPIPGQKGGATTVTHPNGSQTVYRFSALFLLTAVENWFEGRLYNQKVFSYDSKQHICRIETKDGQGHSLLAKIYECDAAGNPISETWEGDFGTFSIRRAFSKNRVVSERHSDGLGYDYSYLRDTHLIASKITLAEETPIRETRYAYDDACNLIEEQEIGKTVTTYLLYQEEPHLHMPEWVIQKDWEGNLIHKTRFAYDQFGNISEEKHYGSDGAFAYQTTATYDSRGNLLEKTNPLNQKATYTYDNRGRAIEQVPFSQDRTIQRTFDAKGRLALLQEENHSTRFAYNSSDELIQKIDYLGLKTHYRYHPVHGKPILIEEGLTRQEISYDDFGRPIVQTDAYGAKTLTTFNSHGDPLTITHPDGGQETFRYAPNKTLLATTDPDGITTTYTYDPLKRPLSKTVGKRKTVYTYDSYNLLSETDPLGISTSYKYNASGQKTQETREQRVVKFTYDPLGFLAKKENGPRCTTYQNDVLGRCIAKSIDGCLNTAYTYDPAGNIATIVKQGATRFFYDAHGRLIQQIDPDGAKTTISYDEADHILTKTIQNPNGHFKVETYNAHDLLIKKESPGCTIEEYTYDRALRLASHDHLAFSYTPQGRLSSMTKAGQRTTFWTYTPGGKVQTKTKPDGTTLHYKYNSNGDLIQTGSRLFEYDPAGRLIAGTGFSRAYDPYDNITCETFATGLHIDTAYDPSDRPIERILPDQSRILYEYEGPFLVKIARINPRGETLYTHTYDQFDANGRPLSETNLFTSSYEYDPMGRRISQQSPYFSEKLSYDESGNLIRKGNDTYSYDAADQMTSSTGQFDLAYDLQRNRIKESNNSFTINELNQIDSLPYDPNGNMALQDFLFDEFDQLVRAAGEPVVYDALGRRIQKGTHAYLYFGDEEVGAFEKGKPIELKIPGLLGPVALEIDNQPYYPIADVQGTIRKLVDPRKAQICQENTCDPFGLGLTANIPYAYLGKRYDSNTGLVYFGKRYYVPHLGRWLTPDPIGPSNHSNLYQYLFNNPYAYQDDQGEFAIAIPLVIWGAELAMPTISACITFLTYTAAVGTVAYTGYKLIEALNNQGYASTGDFYSGDLTPGLNDWSHSARKNTKVYAPDRPLPRDPRTKEPVPEADVPHTELGTKDGTQGKYPQAREFDAQGKPVKDIDFTDHGRPQNHPNPHEHQWKPNPTGGTPQRSPEAKPLTK